MDVDAQLVRALQHDGRATYQEMARSLDLPRAVVSSRLRDLLSSGTVRVVAAVDPGFLGQYVIAHVSIAASGPVQQLADHLKQIGEAVLVSAVGGSHALIAEVRVGSHDELYELLAWIRRQPGVASIETLIYTDVIKGLFISRYQGGATIDDVDIQLIEILQRDGRASYRDLAHDVGLSATAVRSRVQRLLDLRIIKISAVEARGAGGRQISMGIGVNLEGDDQEVVDLLNDSQNVEFIARTVGRFDLVATLASETPSGLLDQLEQLKSLGSVNHAEGWLHLEVIKEDYARRMA